jgi:hypothetical protein
MIEKRRFLISTGFLFLVFFLVYFNLRYTTVLYRFDRCYYGSTWDWEHYFRSVERAGILSPVKQVQSFENDFENLALSPVVKPSQVFTRSGLYSIAANDKSGVTPLHSLRLAEIGYPWPKMIEVQLWMLKNSGRPTGASLGYVVKRGDAILFEDRLPVDSVLLNRGAWTLVKKTFIIPDVYEPDVRIHLFIRNLRQADLYADDLRLKFNYSW